MGNFEGATNFDSSGTLYFDYVYSPEADAVASIGGECTPGPIVEYAPAIHYIGYMQFNARNQLVIQQSSGITGGPIITYSHPSNGSLGTMLGTTTLPNVEGEAPLMLALSSDGNGIWAAPPFRSGFALYKYLQGGAPIRVVHGFRDSSTGAVFPQLVP